MKVVIDTNVWVSALVFGGNPGAVLEAVIDRDLEIIISKEILSEVGGIVKRKFPDFRTRLENLLITLEPFIVHIKLGNIKIDTLRDPKDNMILETAVAGGVGYIISGDKDLLSLKKYDSIRIVSPSDFLKTSVK